MNLKFLPKIISLAGMFLLLVAAYGLDTWIARLKEVNAQTFELNAIILWIYALTGLFVGTAFLWLFWYVLTKTPKGLLVPAVFILLGLLIILSPLLYFSPLVGSLLSFFSPLTIPGSLFFVAGTLSAGTGILSLILPRN